MSNGSVSSFVENLSTRAGNAVEDNAEGYLSLQILISGMILCSLLEEFHPQQIIYSNAVERLVRHLLVLEECVGKEKKYAYLVEKMGFHGIGGGALPETEQLF